MKSNQLPRFSSADRIKIFYYFFKDEKNLALRSLPLEDGISDETFSRYEVKIKRLIPLKNDRKEEDVVINSKFSSLCKLLFDFEKNIDYFGQEEVSKKLVKKNIEKQIVVLQELELLLFKSPKRLPHETLMYFPRFINAAVQVFEYEQRIPNTFISDDNEYDFFAENFFERSYEYLDRAVRCAFVTRKSDVVVKHTGVRSEYVYLYDTSNDSYLTELILHCEETNKEFLFATDFIKDHLAVQSLQELNIEGFFQLISSFSNNKRSLQDIEKQKELLLLPYVHEQMNDISKETDLNRHAIFSMFISAVREKFFVGYMHLNLCLVKLPQADLLSSTRAASSSATKNNATKAIDVIMKILVKRAKSQGMNMLAVAGLGAIAPGIGFILSLLFPEPKPLTKEEVSEMIDGKIKSAISAEKIKNLKNHFEAARETYVSFMNEDIPNLNIGIADKSKWFLGTPLEWERVISDFGPLKQFFLNGDKDHTDLMTQYYTHTLFGDFAGMYISLLYGKIKATPVNGTITATIDKLHRFLNDFDKYLKDLTDFTWNGTLYLYAIQRTKSLPGGTQSLAQYDPEGNAIYRGTHNRGEKCFHTLTMYGRPSAEQAPILFFLETRCRSFALINTLIRPLCEIYDTMTNEFNDFIKDNKIAGYPTQPFITESYLENTVYKTWYHEKMQKYYWGIKETRKQNLGFEDGFNFCGSRSNQEFYDASYAEELRFYPIEDNFVVADYTHSGPEEIISGNNVKLGVCDIASILSSGGDATVKRLIIPRWFIVDLYSDINFQGNKQRFNHGKHIDLNLRVKSMHVRFNMELRNGDPASLKNFIGSINATEMFGSRNGANLKDEFAKQQLISPLPTRKYPA